MVPEVFDVPFATTMGYSPDWRAVMLAGAGRIRETLAPLGRRIGWEVNDPTLLRRILVLRAGLRPLR